MVECLPGCDRRRRCDAPEWDVAGRHHLVGSRPARKAGSWPTGSWSRAIARAARGPVQVPPDLPVVLETALIRRIGDLLGLARRAGQAIAGFEKARDWMRTHPVGLVLQASDGSEAERARFRSAVPDTVPVLAPLTGAELGRMFGHDNVVHVAVAPGRLAEAIVMDAERLAGLRTAPSPGAGVTAGLNGAGNRRNQRRDGYQRIKHERR